MKIDIKRITEGEERVIIRYRAPNPAIDKVIAILNREGNKLWGKCDGRNICISYDEILYLESVDDRIFVYTRDQVLQIDGTLSSFLFEADSEAFFRCSKSMVINVDRVVSLKSLSSNRIDAMMDGGEHITISRRYASEFRRLLKGDR